MSTKQQPLFSASGCLTPSAFERMKSDTLDASDLKLAADHLKGCPFCSMAYEGLKEVDLQRVSTDMEEVKQRLRMVRPLDFMPEQRSLRFKLLIRLISISAIALLVGILIYLMNLPAKRPSSSIISDQDTIQHFRLEAKDTTTARLERKLPDRKSQWEDRVKNQKKRKFR